MTTTARCVVNMRLRPADVPAPAGPDVQRFHAGMGGYRPTPLRAVDGVDIKDESDRFGLPAFKFLGASWAIEQLVRNDPSISALVTASAGNHGRAVGRAAALRELDCRVLLPRTISDRRAELISAEGAEVIRVDGRYDDAVAAAEAEAAAPGVALVADTGTTTSAHWVIDGYSTLFREASTQAVAPHDLIVVPIGVGSLAAAAIRFAAHAGPPATVVGVEPVTAACVGASLMAGRAVTIDTPGTSMTGMDCATPSAAAWPTLRSGLAGIVTVSDEETWQAMRDLADRGVTAGECGAATVAALRALRDDPRCAPLRTAAGLSPRTRVLCVSTEGATDPEAYARIVGSRRRSPSGGG
ncbi:MAG TPA: pyridoxal-phosphate dependent enzyme [Euzebyales bacterium]